MNRLRRMLCPLAVLWLFCQSGFVVTAAALSWSSTSHVLEICTCIHGDHEMCPMHHRPAPGKARCQAQDADETDAAVLSSIFSVAGVLPVQAVVQALSFTTLVLVEHTSPLSLHVPPDSPPPRA